MSFDRLPKTPIDRMIAIAALAGVGMVFCFGLIVTLVKIFAPRAFHDLRRYRVARIASDKTAL